VPCFVSNAHSMHAMEKISLCFIIGAGLLACSSASPVISPVPDSGGQDAGATDAQADTATVDAAPNPECNSLTQLGTAVAVTFNKSPAPPPTGGTTVDGVYVLTSIIGYGTGAAFSLSSKSTLQAKGLEVNVVEDTGTGDKRKTGTGVVQQTALTLTETCAFPKRKLLVEQASFTATATEISLYGQVGPFTLVQTYTKQ
jgi:hypothetical protein